MELVLSRVLVIKMITWCNANANTLLFMMIRINLFCFVIFSNNMLQDLFLSKDRNVLLFRFLSST